MIMFPHVFPVHLFARILCWYPAKVKTWRWRGFASCSDATTCGVSGWKLWKDLVPSGRFFWSWVNKLKHQHIIKVQWWNDDRLRVLKGDISVWFNNQRGYFLHYGKVDWCCSCSTTFPAAFSHGHGIFYSGCSKYWYRFPAKLKCAKSWDTCTMRCS